MDKCSAESGRRSREHFAHERLKRLERLLVIDGQAYTKSSAALRASTYLKAPWRWLSVFLWIPTPVRDFFYGLFAKNRYRLFGKKDECSVPTPQLRARFLT